MLKANVTTVPIQECVKILLEYNRGSNQPSLRALNETQLCAINLEQRSDACQGRYLESIELEMFDIPIVWEILNSEKGDSGGPIFLNNALTGVSTIVGIVSYGISCGTELPSVYTRVASFANWIEQIVFNEP